MVKRLAADVWDLVIIGGGIHGCAVARDAAGRGLSVLLCEQNDLASATSSASSKLIHGGLRYLEQRDFRLVREALTERELLLQLAPHLVHPQTFVLPDQAQIRNPWLLRAGLFLYDRLGHHEILPASKRVVLTTHPAGKALKENFKKGFLYADCATDDARLVIANAQAAAALGATILNYTRCEHITVNHDHYQLTLRDAEGSTHFLQAKGLVNAAGPWVNQILADVPGIAPLPNLKLVKGSHLIVNKLFEGQYAYVLQHTDKRIVFAIPYHNNTTLLGTTDSTINAADINNLQITPNETNYLINLANQYFYRQINAKDIRSSFAGVRALYNDAAQDPAKISREYHLHCDVLQQRLPCLTIYGGKLTTHRALAAAVMDRLQPYYPQLQKAYTQHSYLPGGDLAEGNFEKFLKNLYNQYTWLPPTLVQRYAYQFGSNIHNLLKSCHKTNQLGTAILPELYEIEIDYLKMHEWARTADDILWRRTKLGLYYTPHQQQNLSKYL